ncbi:hypothetical protein TNCV_1451271 [Trichonephila clavipes]|nr:hypothetical protein TNCV_1451271 [Trichonephila clavipes]
MSECIMIVDKGSALYLLQIADEMIILLEQRLKDTEIDRSKLQRENANKEQQIEKLQKSLDETKDKCDRIKKELSFVNKQSSAVCVLMANNEIVCALRACHMMRRSPRLLVCRGHPEPGRRVTDFSLVPTPHSKIRMA